jgi:hypothetical protein
MGIESYPPGGTVGSVDTSGILTVNATKELGLTGATAASRYVGAVTSSNAGPTTGAFLVGDFVVNQAGSIYVCTVAGSPGTWVGMYSDGNGPETLVHTQTGVVAAIPAAGTGVTFMNAGHLLFRDSTGAVSELTNNLVTAFKYGVD